jgi:hypothetical protein
MGSAVHWRAQLAGGGWASLGRKKGPNMLRRNQLTDGQREELLELEAEVRALQCRVVDFDMTGRQVRLPRHAVCAALLSPTERCCWALWDWAADGPGGWSAEGNRGSRS